MKRTALIVAAGRGTRVGGDIPKQYQMLNGAMILTRTIKTFLDCAQISQIQVVIHPDDTAHYKQATVALTDPRLTPYVLGADTRSGSVLAGLAACSGAQTYIHDAARPLLNQVTLARLIAAMDDAPAAFLALPITDALWQVENGQAKSTVARENYWRAQTPQAFRTADIRAAHLAATQSYDDDVATARAAGLDVTPVLGSDQNIKITRPADFALAAKLLGKTMDIRTGNGFDVHKLGAGDHVIICGVKIPHDKSMIGHSDADVGMHAITDAIFGALAMGDIGQWFPPSDPQWKGASSDIFLKKAVQLSEQKGFTITHMDCTLICEHPKIGPHADAMRDALATITGVDKSRISVKATTSETLGFTGRGEGIAAQATATLVKT